MMTLKDRLTEAWATATRFTGDEYVVASHDFVCHNDGSDCTAFEKSDRCKPDNENLRMLSAALELHESQPEATFDDFKLAWAQHMVTQ